MHKERTPGQWIGSVLVAISIALAVMVVGRMAFGQGLEQPIPDAEYTEEARLWLARSLVGEAGWDAPEEHAAIAWVYASRWRASKSRSFLGTVRAYSAAVRNRSNKQHPWIYGLGTDGHQPEGWPVGRARWERYRDRWLDVLAWTDGWAAGYFPTPCPRANHFGGPCDDHRARAVRWYRVQCGVRTRNRFYDSRRRAPRRRAVIPGSPAWHQMMRNSR